MRAPSGAARARLPMTRVELPAEIAPPAPAQSAAFIPPLDLGYTPGGADLLSDPDAGGFAGEFDAPADAWNGETREAVVDDDGYLRFGMIAPVSAAASGSAYASLVVAAEAGSVVPGPVAGGESVRIPPVFTFAPDDSPVIIADVRSQAVPGRRRLVRNANLYRRHRDTGRRPAEIIERDPVDPHTAEDAAAMIGPGGSAVPRAEIRLPSSSLGIGRIRE